VSLKIYHLEKIPQWFVCSKRLSEKYPAMISLTQMLSKSPKPYNPFLSDILGIPESDRLLYSNVFDRLMTDAKRITWSEVAVQLGAISNEMKSQQDMREQTSQQVSWSYSFRPLDGISPEIRNHASQSHPEFVQSFIDDELREVFVVRKGHRINMYDSLLFLSRLRLSQYVPLHLIMKSPVLM
jgi:hypothetical protein